MCHPNTIIDGYTTAKEGHQGEYQTISQRVKENHQELMSQAVCGALTLTFGGCKNKLK
jgi:hypothetical protein